MITCTIAEIPVTIANDKQFSLQKPLGARSILQLTVLDQYGELNFQRGDPVSFSDPDTGETYNGFVNSSMPTKFGLINVFIGHTVTFYDDQYRLQKRTNSDNYFNEFAGDIAVDFARKLAEEGVRVAAAVRRDTSVDDWNQGILSGVTGTGDSADGALQLVKAGSDLTISETTTADFSTGTLTNVTSSDNTLIPTSLSAVKLSAQMLGTLAGSYLALQFWDGSMTVGTSDTLNYDIWCTGDGQAACVDLYFSDGTKLSDSTTLQDQNQVAVTLGTDLAQNATNTWYTRQITLTGLNGKSVIAVTLTVTASGPGTYTAYAKNIYLGSQTGNKFLTTSATTTDVNPPKVYRSLGFAVTSVLSSGLVQVFNATDATRISPGESIDSVKLLGGSNISWNATVLGGVAISISYDNGASYVSCINGAALPALPPGSNVAGTTIKLKEAFVAAGSTDPTIFPALSNVNLLLISAPIATKSDITQNYITSTNWNTGTFTGTTLNGNNLTLGSFTRNWSDNTISNQVFFNAHSFTQSASGGSYSMTAPDGGSVGFFASSQLNFCGQVDNFTLDIDMKINNSQSYHYDLLNETYTVSSPIALSYRTQSFSSTTYPTGYVVELLPNTNIGGTVQGSVSIYQSDGSTLTTLGSSNQTINSGTTYHVKIVVSGNRHRVYFNNSSSALFDVIDTTYTQIGYFGCFFRNTARDWNDNTAVSITVSWDNLVLTPNQSGTWQSASVSISSLGTCGGSAIYWTETGTPNPAVSSVVIQTSIDGGASFQNCTNSGTIPNLTNGINVSGKSIIVKAILSSLSQTYIPMLSGLVWRVLGAYPGSSGTRSTVPLVLDSVNRSNATGTWNTTDDGQSYTKTGTGTIGISGDEAQISNTTGDVHMRPGSRTGTDQEGTVRFSLSASTMSAGLELRYSDANNYYRLQASTTGVSIVKRVVGTTTTLATVSMALDIGAYYHMRFRVTGSNPVSLSGNVWEDGQLENTINPTTYQWDDSLWTISVFD